MPASVRIAVRSLLRRPAVLAVATASLAIGVCVNSTAFSIVDALFLRPPAVSNPEGLVQIRSAYKDSGAGILDWGDREAVAAQAPAFSDVTAVMARGGIWRNGSDMVPLSVNAVGDNYFSMLGVTPALGTLPDANLEAASEPPILLTYWFWRDKMRGRRDVIGQRMEYRDHLWRIAAVLPAGFRGLEANGQRHVWIPLSGWARYWRGDLQRGAGQFELIARLRPGATLEQAQAQLDTVARRIETDDPRVQKGRRLVAASVARAMRERLTPGMLVLAAVGLVLLVACANVASVLLAHAESRRREIALRLSLGAGRLALARQFLAEGSVLAVTGTALGLLLSAWLLGAAPAFAPPSDSPFNLDFRMDLRLLLFSGGCALATLFLFALAPLAYALRISLAESISGARESGGARRPVLRYALVTGQIALCVALAGAAATLGRALLETQAVYPGYDSSRPLALVPAYKNGPGDGRPEFVEFQEAAARVAAVSGVEAVTYARHLPLVDSGGGATVSIIPEGAAPDAPPARVYFNLVGPKFFEVTGARMVAGRAFTDADHFGDAPAAIVNADAANRFWPGQNPLGRMLRIKGAAYRVAGVTANGRISSIHEQPNPAVFLPASRMPWGETIFIARTRPDPAGMLKKLAAAVSQSGNLQTYRTTTLRALVKQALHSDWFAAASGLALATIGLLLAVCGLYGTVSYATERRRREFGIRMAVGAGRLQIGLLAAKQAALPCVVGVATGLGLFAAAYLRQGSAWLEGRPLDAVAMGIGAAVSIAAAAAGTALPALRASRLDPAETTRAE